MRARRLLPYLAAALLLALPACAAPAASGPWQYQYSAGVNEQILRQGQVVAEIRLAKVEFSGAKAAAAVNEYLALTQDLQLADFRIRTEQYLSELEFNGETQENRVYYTQEEGVSVFHNDGQTLSVIVESYAYFSGEPHPALSRRAYSFDAQTGQLLTLADIWGEQAAERAAGEIFAQITAAGNMAEYFPSLEENLLANLGAEDWYADDAHIYIIYNPYEIAPAAAGIVVFTLAR